MPSPFTVEYQPSRKSWGVLLHGELLIAWGFADEGAALRAKNFLAGLPIDWNLPRAQLWAAAAAYTGCNSQAEFCTFVKLKT